VSLWSEKWGGVVFYMSHTDGEMGGFGGGDFQNMQKLFQYLQKCLSGHFFVWWIGGKFLSLRTKRLKTKKLFQFY